VDEEVAFHLEMRVARLERDGMPAEGARERALAEFGDVEELRRSLRESDEGEERRLRWRLRLGELRQDLRFAGRGLRRSPGFAVVALLTLAIGIGASVAMFTVVEAVLLRPLPYPEPGRLVEVLPGQNANIALVDAVGAGAPSLEAVTGLSSWGLTLTGRGEPVELRAQFADASFFRVFGVKPELGRPFRPDERDPARSDVVLLSHALWKGRFGGDPGIVGRRIDLDGYGHRTREVIGVMPEGFAAPRSSSGGEIDVWGPLSRAPGRTLATDSTWYVNAVVGRLAAGATPERASRQVREVMRRLRAEYGGLIDEGSVRTAAVSPLLDSLIGGVRGTLLVLLAAVGVVLLLACINVANLCLARGERREAELAVRTALGGTRGRLIRELLTESTLLALLGGGAGFLLARLLLSALAVSESSGLPRAADLDIDPLVLAFALAATLGSVLVFGLLPAVRASGRVLRPRLGSAGRVQGASRSTRRLGSTLIAGELALALVLVTAAGLLISSLRAIRAVDPGLDAHDVLALELAPPPGAYDGAKAVALYDRLRERLGVMPGVSAVGAIQLLPLTGGNWSFPYLAEGQDPPQGAPLPDTNFRVVTPGYFESVDLPLLSGRRIGAGDRAEGPRVMVINRTLAEQLWPGERAEGKTIRIFGDQAFRVVGVVGDARQHALDEPSRPEVYVPLTQWPLSGMAVTVETSLAPASLVHAASAAVWEVAPDVPVTRARPLSEVVDESLQRRRFFVRVLTFFGVLALGLGAVGVYGVTAYAVGARKREFGVRLALGATGAQVVRTALSAAMAPVVVGLAAGLAGSLAAGRLLAGLLFGVGPRDPLTLALAAFTLGAVAALASWLPARRASRLDPARVLRD
jgi:predicted permease